MARLTMVSYRQLSAVLFIVPALLLAFGYYLQFVEGIEPCPLCMTQRLAFYAIAITAIIAFFTPQSLFLQHLWAAVSGIFALIGMGVAGRQIWLQHLPEDQVPACGPGFEFIINSFPLSEAIQIMFRGNGNCAEVHWTLLSLSIAEWSFLAFSGLLLLCLLKIVKS
jgi:disulfide bond formation protein DsbB